jgi:ankyrin repeat protein
VNRFLEHMREGLTRNLMEQRTIDDYKATPLLIAVLGGHLDVVELLARAGADVTAKLDFRGVKHGAVEVALIREDMSMLLFFSERVESAAVKIVELMAKERLDLESRASVGRALHKLALEYQAVKNG